MVLEKFVVCYQQQQQQLESIPHTIYKLNSNWIVDTNVKSKRLNILDKTDKNPGTFSSSKIPWLQRWNLNL